MALKKGVNPVILKASTIDGKVDTSFIMKATIPVVQNPYIRIE